MDNQNGRKMEITATGTQFNTNPIWEILWKINMAIVPFIVMWLVWVTVNVFDYQAWKQQGPRFTQKDAEILKKDGP